MNKIYISENYIIVEDSRGIFQFSQSRTLYNERTKDGITSFIMDESEDGRYYIDTTEVTGGLWFDETGTIPYTIATLRTFLRSNTGNFNKGGATTFEDLTDVPSYLNNAFKWLRINGLETGIEAIESEEIETYRTEWKPFPVFNGSYGLANTGNPIYRPQIKIVNRTVYVSGFYVLPMPTSAGGGVLDTNAQFYTLQGKTFSDLYLNASDGYTIDSKNQAITGNPVLPTVLRPEEHIRVNPKTVMSKTKNITGGRMRLNAWCDGFFLLSDGRIYIRSMEANERNGDTGTGWNKNNLSRTIVSKFNTGDKLMNFDNYRNALDGAGLDTLRVPNEEGYTFQYNMDGNRSNDFGGFVPELTFSYPLNNTFTLAQIKSAFDSL